MTAASLPARPSPDQPRALVVTGATGFVGRRVVEALRVRSAAGSTCAVTLLVRDPASPALPSPLPDGWRVVPCDLARDDPPPGAIARGSVVLHLAAATGRLAPAVMRAVNVEGTRRLVEGARSAGAAHLVFVSSIAAGFADRRWYHYAEAKRDAERLVAGSAVPHTVVRPTMVFGPGSPVQEGLRRLATGGAPIVLGRGDVAVQPVHVDDLAAVLVALASMPPGDSTTLEVGGRDRMSLRALLAHMRAASGLPPRDPWSVPLAAPRLALALAERVVGPRLPVTAGQLASFVNDSAAAPNAVVQHLLPAARTLRDMLDGDVAPIAGPAANRDSAVEHLTPADAEPDATLAKEFATFARYLGTRRPSPRATSAYVRAHQSAAAVRGDRFDRWLVALARRSALACGLADAYARLARPYGPLRRRLVLALAVLESSPAVHREYDTARPSARPVAWAALMTLGMGWMLRTACAVVVLAPLQLAARVAGNDATHG
ncbi:MAG: NAD(P)H-binding protein [Gemmatimonadetes bacterium]|nr:NAD(P)H-binding protein [Gemmatimonadota bacterium]